MDLYADLPLAKGAATTALDADGKLKSSSSASGTSLSFILLCICCTDQAVDCLVQSPHIVYV